ncbi:MAG: L-threonylcarbamoyladenylate synthase [Candidatus Hodarchaeota archaeon]
MKSRILTIDDIDDCKTVISEAAAVLLDGGLVVYPTDTSYGLACDPRQEDALEKLIKVKRRDRKIGVPLLFSDLTQCEHYHEFGSLERIIARLFWPGALTLVVIPKDTVPSHITAGRGSVAIRVPDHIVPRGITRELGAPIVGTSANRSGGDTPFDLSIAREQLRDEVDLYLDGGPSRSSSNSTIVGVEGVEDGSTPLNIKVYREGLLTIDKISESLRVDSDAVRFWTNRIIYPDM